MTKQKTLKVERRKVLGRKTKTLRGQGILPANIFGKDFKSTSISLPVKDFETIYKEIGETGIVELQVKAGKSQAVLVSNVQLDPVTDKPIHVDFRAINLKEKVTATVPVEVVGDSPAEKSGLGTLVQMVDEVPVEALPLDLPEKLEAEVSGLAEVDATVLIKDLKYNKAKVEIKEEQDRIVAKVEAMREEEEEPEALVPEGEEGAVEGEESDGEMKEGEEKKIDAEAKSEEAPANTKDKES